MISHASLATKSTAGTAGMLTSTARTSGRAMSSRSTSASNAAYAKDSGLRGSWNAAVGDSISAAAVGKSAFLKIPGRRMSWRKPQMAAGRPEQLRGADPRTV
jgi:hypothetical protein